ncbi:hypothetical protein SESBI_43619 [Sesbania bispinosa]|nr:hypothetical protein SESBI_43619 [Sesbania bispinosa]
MTLWIKVRLMRRLLRPRDGEDLLIGQSEVVFQEIFSEDVFFYCKRYETADAVPEEAFFCSRR